MCHVYSRIFKATNNGGRIFPRHSEVGYGSTHNMKPNQIVLAWQRPCIVFPDLTRGKHKHTWKLLQNESWEKRNKGMRMCVCVLQGTAVWPWNKKRVPDKLYKGWSIPTDISRGWGQKYIWEYMGRYPVFTQTSPPVIWIIKERE